MKKIKIKDEQLLIKLTAKQKEEIRKGAERKNQTMSAYVLDRTLNPMAVSESPEMLEILEKHCSDVRNFQLHQQVNMYIMMQFIMWLTNKGESREEIMEFYDEQYEIACKQFRKKD